MKKKIMLGVAAAATLVSVAFAAAGAPKLPKAEAEGHFTVISHVCRASSPDLKGNFTALELCLQLIKAGKTTLVKEEHFTTSLSNWNTYLQAVISGTDASGATELSKYDSMDQARINKVAANVTTAAAGAASPASFVGSSLQ